LSTLPVVATLKDKLAKVDARFKATCFTVKSKVDGKEQEISGTLISLKGLPSMKKNGHESVIISKSSMLGDNPVAVDASGHITKLSIVARSRADDLVLLLPAKDLHKGIVIPATVDSIAFSQLGTFLLSPVVDSTARVGVLGSLYINLPNATSYGYIGAATELKNDKLIFKTIMPNSAAALAGLKLGDIISTIGGHTVEDELDFVSTVGRYQAGDTVSVGIITGDKSLVRNVVLQYPPQRHINHPAELFDGGKSIRRDGFKNVFIQDARVRPTECGGPVFDMNNNFVGINIARLSRTSTVVMPVSRIVRFMELMK
jgi:serine protease Do